MSLFFILRMFMSHFEIEICAVTSHNAIIFLSAVTKTAHRKRYRYGYFSRAR